MAGARHMFLGPCLLDDGLKFLGILQASTFFECFLVHDDRRQEWDRPETRVGSTGDKSGRDRQELAGGIYRSDWVRLDSRTMITVHTLRDARPRQRDYMGMLRACATNQGCHIVAWCERVPNMRN